jgi:hypothetical protein
MLCVDLILFIEEKNDKMFSKKRGSSKEEKIVKFKPQKTKFGLRSNSIGRCQVNRQERDLFRKNKQQQLAQLNSGST